ncbi:MAG: NAD-dependent epimerase/dehydratase family protein, partial [Actinobacteria bacterium]|nr:NAD-dependent epimerase/dehydratase family protein [Actinomycetota bacterium]
MNIVISGASGLVGTALQERLRAEGHSVTNLVRKAPSNAN